MAVTASKGISASMDRVWAVITDIDNCDQNISGIQSVKILEKPEQGVIGLKWQETRVMFGKEAVETMWISAADAPRWYETTAHNHGSIYTSRMEIKESSTGCTLTMSFSSEATTFASRLMSVMSFLFNGALRKMIEQDLDDIKKVAETE